MSRFDRDELLRRVDLRQLADELLGGHCGSERSPTWSCPVPTHAQTGQTPPLSIFVTRWGEERWRCHGCGASGSAIDLVMHAHGIDVRGAMEWLSQRSGPSVLDPPQRSRSTKRRPAARAEPHPAIDDYVAECEATLWNSTGRGPRRWLTETRCLDEDVLRLNRVGFDPGVRHLGRPDGVPRSAGVVLPVLDGAGRAVFTQTRRLGQVKGPKYLNCANRVAPNPRLAMYRGAVTEGGPLIICEGAFDALSAVGAGLQSAALLGSTIADERVADKIASHGGRIVLAFDADASGDRGAARLASMLTERGRSPVRLRPGAEAVDLNEWCVRTGTGWGCELGGSVRASVSRSGQSIGVLR